MKTMTMILLMCAVIFTVGCSGKYKKVEQGLDDPINCATAEGDIRMLRHEKAHVTDQIAAGVSSFSPAGLVIGVASGTEGTGVRVTSGKYNEMIDKRIAEIQAKCGVK